jgi:uncharacterized protein
MNEHESTPPTPPIQQHSPPDNIWVVLCHLTALTLFIGIPFGNIIGPLIIWLIKKHEFPSVDAHGKESLNFQISMTIYTLIAGLSVFILVGFILLPAVLIANLVLVIIAAIKASNREFYRYPLTIRLIT